ncbi:hypothetical protein D9758_015352 [Tetrapyrgos nigripes]|uniref:MYND-type domain-containing protein n=1 Tax=Tetrapyrgos nigripes TaxID=182062 RepID=A0A8H5FNX9_9AGAR|nr:hypothetical protein D9758_015352 [Tetrapyrgos nigripes]
MDFNTDTFLELLPYTFKILQKPLGVHARSRFQDPSFLNAFEILAHGLYSTSSGFSSNLPDEILPMLEENLERVWALCIAVLERAVLPGTEEGFWSAGPVRSALLVVSVLLFEVQIRRLQMKAKQQRASTGTITPFPSNESFVTCSMQATGLYVLLKDVFLCSCSRAKGLSSHTATALVGASDIACPAALETLRSILANSDMIKNIRQALIPLNKDDIHPEDVVRINSYVKLLQLCTKEDLPNFHETSHRTILVLIADILHNMFSLRTLCNISTATFQSDDDVMPALLDNGVIIADSLARFIATDHSIVVPLLEEGMFVTMLRIVSFLRNAERGNRISNTLQRDTLEIKLGLVVKRIAAAMVFRHIECTVKKWLKLLKDLEMGLQARGLGLGILWKEWVALRSLIKKGRKRRHWRKEAWGLAKNICSNPSCTDSSDSSPEAGKRKLCTNCMVHVYCSPSCQAEHWDHDHRRECRVLASEQQSLGLAPLSAYDIRYIQTNLAYAILREHKRAIKKMRAALARATPNADQMIVVDYCISPPDVSVQNMPQPSALPEMRAVVPHGRSGRVEVPLSRDVLAEISSLE